MISMFGEYAVPIFVCSHVTDPGPYVKNVTAGLCCGLVFFFNHWCLNISNKNADWSSLMRREVISASPL